MRFLWLLSVLVVTASYADSLYTPQSRYASLFADHKACRVGDVLHILITETAQASQQTQDNTANSTDAKLGPGLGKLSFLPLVGYAGTVQAQSKGTTNRSGTFTARLAVMVVEVAPNGNLLVEGTRSLTVHNDQQLIKLRGEVRPQDVAADGTIASYKVANATISYTGTDPLRPGSKVGIITRALHWLF